MCSGHGWCGNDDQCHCYNNWVNGDETSGDCSQRLCPFERAWIDIPSEAGVAHALAECSGRGLCNRDTGECDCFPGYTGQGCQRTTCPNECNGHGICVPINELRTDVGDDFKYSGQELFEDEFSHELYNLWDYEKTMGCQCDARWTDVDCSRRKCPRNWFNLYNNMVFIPEVQQIVLTNVSYPYGEFALLFRSRLGEEFITVKLDAFEIIQTQTDPNGPDAIAPNLANMNYNQSITTVQTALEQLPNFVLQNVMVDFNFTLSGHGVTQAQSIDHVEAIDIVISVTFEGDQTSGDQYLIECLSENCPSVCYPVLSKPIGVTGTCTVSTVQEATSLNYECSGRGKCNYDTGVCECFEGYTDEGCGTQTALI